MRACGNHQQAVENVALELGHRIRAPHWGLRTGLQSVRSSWHLPVGSLPHVGPLAHGSPAILVSGSKPSHSSAMLSLLLLLFPIHCNLFATKPFNTLLIYPFSSSPSGLSKVKPFLLRRSSLLASLLLSFPSTSRPF